MMPGSKKGVSLTTQNQSFLVITIILTALAIEYLFDILWAPIVFMFYGVWIIMNPGKELTDKELAGFFTIAVGFLVYSMAARLGGVIFALIWVAIWEIFFLSIYVVF